MIVLSLARVTAESAVESGVPTADELAPVIALAPEKAVFEPVALTVP